MNQFCTECRTKFGQHQTSGHTAKPRNHSRKNLPTPSGKTNKGFFSLQQQQQKQQKEKCISLKEAVGNNRIYPTYESGCHLDHSYSENIKRIKSD